MHCMAEHRLALQSERTPTHRALMPMRYLEVIPHFNSDLIIDSCSFLHHNPSHQKQKGQGDEI